MLQFGQYNKNWLSYFQLSVDPYSSLEFVIACAKSLGSCGCSARRWETCEDQGCAQRAAPAPFPVNTQHWLA